MIELRGAALEAGGRSLLAATTLTLGERRVGLAGLNGSGKSTLLRLLGGLLAPSSGTVAVGGYDTVADARAVRRVVGYLFQNPEAQLVLPRVREDVALGLTRGKPTAAQRRQVDAMLERLGIGALAERLTHRLSGGEQQLVALAGALAREPQVLLFDEPTTHLDLRFSARLRELIDDLPQQVVLASHDLELLAACERVIVLDGGTVHCDGDPEVALAAYRELARWS